MLSTSTLAAMSDISSALIEVATSEAQLIAAGACGQA
jgi:hypothetical protein